MVRVRTTGARSWPEVASQVPFRRDCPGPTVPAIRGPVGLPAGWACFVGIGRGNRRRAPSVPPPAPSRGVSPSRPMSRAPGHALTARTPTSTSRRSAAAVAYTLRRSPRSRGLRVTIDPWKGVVVSVPPPTRRGWAHPEERVEAFLRARHRWISRHLDRFQRERAELDDRGGLTTGGVLRYRGELHRLRIELSATGVNRSTVTREGLEGGDELVIRVAAADRRRMEVVLVDWFRERANEAIDRAIATHAHAMRVSPTAVSLRDPRTRWGSASRAGRLSFSWRLVLAPPEALETVVVHELAHLRVFGHGHKFWDLVAGRRPDHRAWRRWLHDHSTELHSAVGRGDRAGVVSAEPEAARLGEPDEAIA